MDYCLTGALLGDIAASHALISGEDRKAAGVAFSVDDSVTGCSVLNLATRLAIDSGMQLNFERAYRYMVRRYPRCGYDPSFERWACDKSAAPYRGWDATATVRVAYIGDCAANEQKAARLARESAACSHADEDAQFCAELIALCCYKAVHGYDVRDIWRYAESHVGRILPLNEYEAERRVNRGCLPMVKLALRCFIDSTDFASALENALRLECDICAVATMAGALAGGYYKKLPDSGVNKLPRILPAYLYDLWQGRIT